MIKSTDGYFVINGNKEYMPDYKKLLSDSVFYPGCGKDNMDLQTAKSGFSIYVHADYRITKLEAEAFLNDIKGFDEYELESTYEFYRSILFPVDKDMTATLMPMLPIKKSEEAEFEKFNITNSKTPDTFLMGVYVLAESSVGKTVISPFSGKEQAMPPVLLVFFFYEDAIPLFNSLYFFNKINPKAVVLSENMPDRPYWTNLAAADHRFRLVLLINHLYNHCPMPSFLITDYPQYYEQNSVKRFEWKEYYAINQLDESQYKSLDTERQIHVYERDMLVV